MATHSVTAAALFISLIILCRFAFEVRQKRRPSFVQKSGRLADNRRLCDLRRSDLPYGYRSFVHLSPFSSQISSLTESSSQLGQSLRDFARGSPQLLWTPDIPLRHLALFHRLPVSRVGTAFHINRMNFVSTVDKHLAGSPLIDAMATPSLIRHINQTRVLRLLKEEGTLSRAELARSLNLTRSTLTSVTDELMEMNLVIEAGQSFITQATGRPGAGLKLNPEGPFFLGARLTSSTFTSF